MIAHPIGIFDSGLGGLSVLREVRRRLPNQALLYLADHARLPYGARPPSQVRQFSEEITRFLLARRSKIIVVACNTASAAALSHLRVKFPTTPFVGMEPAIKPAAFQSSAKVVGVLATEATFQGNLFANVLREFAQGVTVLTRACPGWVDLVETGQLESSRALAMMSKDIAPLMQGGADTLVLACTHYSFLHPIIARLVDPSIQIIDPCTAVARQVERVLTQQGLMNSENSGGAASFEMYSTGAETETLRQRVRDLIGEEIKVRQARLE